MALVSPLLSRLYRWSLPDDLWVFGNARSPSVRWCNVLHLQTWVYVEPYGFVLTDYLLSIREFSSSNVSRITGYLGRVIDCFWRLNGRRHLRSEFTRPRDIELLSSMQFHPQGTGSTCVSSTQSPIEDKQPNASGHSKLGLQWSGSQLIFRYLGLSNLHSLPKRWKRYERHICNLYFYGYCTFVLIQQCRSVLPDKEILFLLWLSTRAHADH